MNPIIVTRKLIMAVMLFGGLLLSDQLAAQEQQIHAGQVRYKLVVIDTFGGPNSFINPASVFGSPRQINEHGIAVGAGATSVPTTTTSNAFICGGTNGVVSFVYHAFKWDGTLIDLGSLDSDENCSAASSINASGAIAGTSEQDGEIDPALHAKQIRAVIWKNGGIRSLGTFGGKHSAAAANNNRGEVVGFALNAIPDPFSYLDFLLFGGVSTGTQTRAFLWHGGKLQDLGTLGGPDSAGTVLNDRGQVAGSSYTNFEPNPITGAPPLHSFLWENGKMIDLGTLGGAFSGPLAINNRGQVVGFSTTANEEHTNPFFWESGRPIDLFKATKGKVITANAINDAGQVVGGGDFSNVGGSPFSAVLWSKGVVINLGTLPGDCFSEAYAINDNGQVVGASFACDTFENRAFLWENGSIIDLNEKVPSDLAVRLANAVAINERGEIGGFAAPSGCADAESCGRAFLLLPAEEPGEKAPVLGAITPMRPDIKGGMTGLTGREVSARIQPRFMSRRLPFLNLR